MVSDYLGYTRSIREYKDLIEAHKNAAASIAAAIFDQEVTEAVSRVSEIDQISRARIQADSQIASSKIATEAQISSLELLSKAELIIIEFGNRDTKDGAGSHRHRSMVMETTRQARDSITTSASEAVDSIQMQAEQAIEYINAKGRDAINDIQNHAVEVKNRIEQ